MKLNIASVLIPTVLPAAAGLAQAPAPVMTECGLVQGVAEIDLTVYRGIPFAAPPVGNLRWRALPYVLQTLDCSDARLTPCDWTVSGTVSTYCTNFAKRGDPNGEGVPVWPRFTDGDRQAMSFKNTARPGPVPSADALAVLDAHFAWRRTPEGMAWAK